MLEENIFRFTIGKLQESMRKMSSPKLLRKISMTAKQRPFRIAILGQNGVGKSALTVRFLTRRFIGDYDPELEKVYTCTRYIDSETVLFEVLDTAAQEEKSRIEENIKWADAFILMYAVTDRCSFGEVNRLRFLINSYAKRQRKSSSVSSTDLSISAPPCVLVGNQIDRTLDRMVSEDEGRKRSYDLACVSFYEISVRESIESVSEIFEDIYTMCRKPKKSRPLLMSKQTSVPMFITEEKSDDSGSENSKTATLNRRRKAVFSIC